MKNDIIQKPKLYVSLEKINKVDEIDFQEKITDKEIVNIALIDDERFIEFNGCIIKNVSFEDLKIVSSQFIDCRFENCNLSNCDMEMSHFLRCEFINCKLVGFSAPKSHFDNVCFKECNGKYLNLSNSKYHNVAFISNEMVQSTMIECQFNKVIFENTNLTEMEFHHTSLADIDLSTCLIDGIIVTMEDLRGVAISYAQMMEIAALLNIRIV